jgi:type IV pilus assembly protein PilE
MQRGYSIIELVIAVAIVAILAAIAWPAYSEHVARVERLRAQLDLMEAAQYLQRGHASNGTYDRVVLPERLARSPHDGPIAYRLAAAIDPSGQAYLLSAEPLGARAADRCGTLSLRSTGQRGNATGQAVSDCWR